MNKKAITKACKKNVKSTTKAMKKHPVTTNAIFAVIGAQLILDGVHRTRVAYYKAKNAIATKKAVKAIADVASAMEIEIKQDEQKENQQAPAEETK